MWALAETSCFSKCRSIYVVLPLFCGHQEVLLHLEPYLCLPKLFFLPLSPFLLQVLLVLALLEFEFRQAFEHMKEEKDVHDEIGNNESDAQPADLVAQFDEWAEVRVEEQGVSHDQHEDLVDQLLPVAHTLREGEVVVQIEHVN